MGQSKSSGGRGTWGQGGYYCNGGRQGSCTAAAAELTINTRVMGSPGEPGETTAVDVRSYKILTSN